MALSMLNPVSFLPQCPFPSPKSPPMPIPLVPSRNLFTLHLKTQFANPFLQPKFPLKTSMKVEEKESPHRKDYKNPDLLSVAFPSLAFSNTLLFSSIYNVQVIVGEGEPDDQLISRFRREVLKPGVLEECKRRRYFETTQDKRKRKTREAARRNRKRRQQPKVSKRGEVENSKKERTEYDSDDDNWDFFVVDLPYT
ncbi:hypothetical protein CDL12_20780 [Handroanthus impetiginosus]|uniref:Uncharacterized protein n=1 Tax=Handroanthus impetiginosus TaxID=429701 RepID=A0A2G9GMY7_9LAMI|nr:hypothetical protein CDL12_20780 [Handroanthus impetiginosus]